MIKIFNEDCMTTMASTLEEKSVDVVITSPPYNNSRTCHSDYCMKTANCRYEEYDDNKTNDEYCDWLCKIFSEGYDRIVKDNGVVLFNISYGSENPDVMFRAVYDIVKNTNWMIADCITWKKKSALPNNVSSNKLTRICEFVFVFCRKNEYATFKCNKKVTSVSNVGQKFYSVMYNYIEADNNDGANALNNAAFSTDFVMQLLEMYAEKSCDTVVYDSFMGTGTTAVACKMYGVSCYGSEISKKQCDYAENRLVFNNCVKSIAVDADSSAKKFSFEDLL